MSLSRHRGIMLSAVIDTEQSSSINDFALSNKFQSFTKMFVQKLKEIVNSFVSPFKFDSAVSWTPLSQTATKMDCFSGRKKVDAIFYLCKIDTVLSNYFCLP